MSLRRWGCVDHFLAGMWFRSRPDTNSRREILSKEEIRDITTGHYRRFESGDDGIESVDVVEAFIELDGRESGCRCKSRNFPL